MKTDTVPVGLSEIVTLLTLIGSMLTAVFGGDWGVTANAQQFAGVAVVLLPIGLSLARAIKHHGVSAGASVPLLPLEVTSVAAVSADPVADAYPGDLAPVVADAGHSEVDTVLLVLSVVGVFLLLFGVTLH